MLSRNRKQKQIDKEHRRKEQCTTVAGSSNGTSLHNSSSNSHGTIQNGSAVASSNTPLSISNMPAICAAPTVDTLDDGSLFRNRAYQGILSNTISSPAIKKVRDDHEHSGVMRHRVSFTPTNLNSTYSFNDSHYSYNHHAYSPVRKKQIVEKVKAVPNPSNLERQQKRRNERRLKQQAHDFQHDEDAMTVAVRSVNIAQRSAFEWTRNLSIEEWHIAAQRVQAQSRSKNSNANNSAHKKLSPSLQHLQLLQALQSRTTIRQLAFSPSCGINADIFVPWWKDTLEEGNTNSGGRPQLKRRMSSVAEQRDGRYRSIHPVRATVSALPSVPPFLSNKKKRLPMRADVGFPNTSEEEIELKQTEINHETEWEEASPRLIVLVTSDDLGTAVQEESQELGVDLEHLEWNGGGLQAMPWAGKELLRTKELTALHFSRRNSILEHTRNDPAAAAKRRLLEPNRASILAPPLDASYSETLGWRPRPFHDRPSGMEYLLCWPLEVSFDAGDIEPLVCSLALYSLPVDSESGGSYGKMSEEFTFQAGNWDGRIEIDPSLLTVPSSSRDEGELGVHAEEHFLDSLRRRKQKAIFSYDPLALSGGKESLHWVLQVFRVAHGEPAAAYLSEECAKRKGNGIKKLFKSKPPPKHKDEDFQRQQEVGANQFFDKYGTKYMMALGYGVVSVYPKDTDRPSEGQDMAFPGGRMQSMNLFAASDNESQENFVQRLTKVAQYQELTNSCPSENGDKSVVLPRRSSEQNVDVPVTSELASTASSASDRSIPNRSFNLTNSSHTDEKGSKIDNSPLPHKKKSLAHRIFKSPAKATRSMTSSSSGASQQHVFLTTDDLSSSRSFSKPTQVVLDQSIFKPLSARVDIFMSALSVDFLQAILSEPTDMDGYVFTQHPHASLSTPKILCDVTGDVGVMLEDRQKSKKRSNLARLPPHRVPAGYTVASEIREILYLPARPEKQYDLDIPPPYRSSVNLLYIYPRLLRSSHTQKTGKQKKDTRNRFTMRVRLIQSSVDVDEDSGQVASSSTVLEAFHNVAPWTGSSLVKEVYTKLPKDAPSNYNEKRIGQSARFEQLMKDEFKLRLPLVLDGSFFLQFTLFEIFSDETNAISGSSSRAIAENTIPLSSSTTRDSSDAVRVATVIPNGCHRLALGDFKFYVESRLVSSVHVGDVAVAAALRDFPLPSLWSDQSGSSEEVGSVLSHPPSLSDSLLGPRTLPDSVIAYPALFGNASEGTLVGHLQILLHMHLSNMVGSVTTDHLSPPRHTQFMMGNISSLFEILRKVKARLDPSGTASIVNSASRERLDMFFKKHLDEFEESFLLPSSGSQLQDERASDLGSEIIDFTEARTGSTTKDDILAEEDDSDDEAIDEGAVRVRYKDSLRTGIDARLSKRGSVGMDITSVSSFSRVAYGASKTDWMKIEAEMYYDGGRMTHLPVFDDDETIVTAGTSLHNITDVKRKQMAAALEGQNSGSNFVGIQHESSAHPFHSESSVRAATVAASRAVQGRAQDNTSSNVGFAKRVKTVAEVMLQPCVASNKISASPRSLSLDCGRSSRTKQKGPLVGTDSNPAIQSNTNVKKQQEQFIFPGSDAEEDDDIVEKNDRIHRPASFRGPRDGLIMKFTIQGVHHYIGKDLPVAGGQHVYEAIILLWLRAYSDYDSDRSKNGVSDIPIMDLSSRATNLLFDFFSHLDVLLPLCLKSFALRHGIEVQHVHGTSDNVVLDKDHAAILEMLAEILARCLMGQALAYTENADFKGRDKALLRALASSEWVVEFFQGLLAFVHPENMHRIIKRYFKTLRTFETEHVKENSDGLLEFSWTERTIHRVRSSRQLRLRAVEMLSVLPSFLALNFPMKFSCSTAWSGDNTTQAESTWMMQYSDTGDKTISGKAETRETDCKLPQCGWLARLVVDEGLSICALSCEAVVAEAMAHIELSQNHSKHHTTSVPLKQTSGLKRLDLLMLQGLAIHAITCVYELVLRRHAMDKRFQTDSCRGRIAALCAESIFTQSLQSVRWLARMESTHKVRSIWLLSLVYILQEIPEVLLRDLIRTYCDSSDIRIHRFIRLLRLGSSTFQSFVDQPRHSMFPESVDKSISPWLLQESFNTICATTNIVVEECVRRTATNPKEQKKMMHAVLDLLLHILTTPQSAVTHLRAVGGALQALEEFGVDLFLDVVGSNLQHWVRVIQSLLNSTSLSVRSISVDFVLSLLGNSFDLLGNIDEILLVCATVLPEVAAREIGLYSVNGHIKDAEDLERALWPLRRSFADLEDANPLDDDRIDPELSPVLKTFCRAQQSILDGVLIELRLRKQTCIVVGTKICMTPVNKLTFDADEESLFEAADFFQPESAPLQRIRWLLTLKSLHEAKSQWVEAAESLVACARTISDAIPYLKNVWRPSRFVLWSDTRRSIWLETVGEDMGHPDRGNAAVMDFADAFLEPDNILGTSSPILVSGRLQQPTVAAMCDMLTIAAKEAVRFYLLEDGMDEIAYVRLENLLQIVMNVLIDHGSLSLDRDLSIRSMSVSVRKRQVEDEAALRRVSASLSGDMTNLAEKLLLVVQNEPGTPKASETQSRSRDAERGSSTRLFYVLVTISGSRPKRFQESTTLPTFLDWNAPCVLRVPKHLVDTAQKKVGGDTQRLEKQICLEVGGSLRQAISDDPGSVSLVLNPGSDQEVSVPRDSSKTYLEIFLVWSDSDHYDGNGSLPLQSKRFFYKKPAMVGPRPNLSDSNKQEKNPDNNRSSVINTLMEVTVARTFPCVLSRQRTLLTSEILSTVKY